MIILAGVVDLANPSPREILGICKEVITSDLNYLENYNYKDLSLLEFGFKLFCYHSI